jgi:benzoate/toluate 1,2-dioxygenase reductase component
MGKHMTYQASRTSGNCHTSRILHRQWLTRDTFSLTLERPPGFHFQAGQRIRLLTGGKTRDYSLIPGDAHHHLTLLIRSVENGVVSTRLSRDPLGAPLDFTGPGGHFTYRPSSRPAIWIATGTGIAPFAAMCRTGITGFVLLHGVRHGDDLYFQDLMEPAALSYVPCLTGTPSSRPSHAFPGRVSDYLRHHFPEGEYDFYLAGQREMIAEVMDIVDHRFPSSRVYSEIFF